MRPEDYGIIVPPDLDEEMFRDGFAHGMQSNTLKIFKKSYGEGFRAAKLLCKQLRKEQGIIDFPVKGRMKIIPKK